MDKCGADPELLSSFNSIVVCMICGSVPFEPYLCKSCNKLIGKSCYENHKNKKCACCKKGEPINYIGGKKLMNELIITHILCGKQMKFEEYQSHIAQCKEKKKIICQNEQCNALISGEPQYYAKTGAGQNGERLIACSLTCIPKIEIQELVKMRLGKSALTVMKDICSVIDEAYKENEHMHIAKPGIEIQQGICSFGWSTSICPEMKIENNGCRCILDEPTYLFRTMIADQPFKTRLIYYWEILGNASTENEMKIGVVTSKNFQVNTAFCDYEFGFAYYGTGQLRHSSNSTGNKYGKAFKNQGKLGVCLNMFEGTLSFALDDEFMGVAFTNELLKNPPIWPAVSLLHKAICDLRVGVSLPACFQISNI